MTYENNIANQFFRNKDYENAEKYWIISVNKKWNEARFNLGNFTIMDIMLFLII